MKILPDFFMKSQNISSLFLKTVAGKTDVCELLVNNFLKKTGGIPFSLRQTCYCVDSVCLVHEEANGDKNPAFSFDVSIIKNINPLKSFYSFFQEDGIEQLINETYEVCSKVLAEEADPYMISHKRLETLKLKAEHMFQLSIYSQLRTPCDETTNIVGEPIRHLLHLIPSIPVKFPNSTKFRVRLPDFSLRYFLESVPRMMLSIESALFCRELVDAGTMWERILIAIFLLHGNFVAQSRHLSSGNIFVHLILLCFLRY
jgi:hypothetical protein